MQSNLSKYILVNAIICRIQLIEQENKQLLILMQIKSNREDLQKIIVFVENIEN